jgi:uncharacterized protein (DUF1778 family)
MSLATSTLETARLEARISISLHGMLKRAAQLQGRTMTDFVIDAVQSAARSTIEKADLVTLTMADQEAFAHALLAPPKPKPSLKRAFSRRKKLLKST